MPTAYDPFERPELLHTTARAREIELLQRVYDGKQYDGRPDWWTGRSRPGEDPVPLRHRRPCIIYKLPKAAVGQVSQFLWGDETFPQISVPESEGGEHGYPDISGDDAEELSKWLGNLISSAGVKSLMGELAEKAIACKTAVVIASLHDGKFKFELPEPQHCYAQFDGDDPRNEVVRLLWTYQFDREIVDDKGRIRCKRYVFRREWDTRNVTIYDDAELGPGGEVKWATPRFEPHGLEFCPVQWIRNDGEHSTNIDGESLIADQIEEFEALDMALSRRHQGIIHLGSPQLVETGVDPNDESPGSTGRKGGPSGFSPAVGAGYAVEQKARKTGPEYVWRYEGEKVSVSLLETSGKAFEVGTLHVTDIRSRALESMSVVLTSMTDTIGRSGSGASTADMSARFLKLAHAPLIALTQKYRDHWWPNVLRPLLSMLARMVADTATDGDETSPPRRVFIPGTQAILPLLKMFSVRKTSDTDIGGWIEPQMVASWGQFFSPDMEERRTGVEAVIAAKDGQIITGETAVEFGAPLLGVENVRAEIEALKEGPDELTESSDDEGDDEKPSDEPEQQVDDDDSEPEHSAEGEENVDADSMSASDDAQPNRRRRRRRGRRRRGSSHNGSSSGSGAAADS